jgi:hypothetical protein
MTKNKKQNHKIDVATTRRATSNSHWRAVRGDRFSGYLAAARLIWRKYVWRKYFRREYVWRKYF